MYRTPVAYLFIRSLILVGVCHVLRTLKVFISIMEGERLSVESQIPSCIYALVFGNMLMYLCTKVQIKKKSQ